MSTVIYRFLEPLDVLFLRGNKLFGHPGSFGESLVPPWPSVAAGALRSRILSDDGVDLSGFADGRVEHPSLGTPQKPGSFAVTAFQLARRLADGRVEALFAPPADVVIGMTDVDQICIHKLEPISLDGVGAASGATFSYPLPLLPVLAQGGRGKATSGYWLTECGWARYLMGKPLVLSDLVASSRLWRVDVRVGVGLDAAMRRASDGRLFSAQAVAMVKDRQAVTGPAYDVGFLVGVTGAEPPTSGTVRLGGDGRAAAISESQTSLPEPDYAAIVRERRCRMVLTTPGLFSEGWLPTGCSRAQDGCVRLDLHGLQARLVSAAVPRAEVVSGWDLAMGRPKPALRAVPAGGVYWLDELNASPEVLRKLVESGLWNEDRDDASRRAEGFNRVTFAIY